MTAPIGTTVSIDSAEQAKRENRLLLGMPPWAFKSPSDTNPEYTVEGSTRSSTWLVRALLPAVARSLVEMPLACSSSLV